MGLLSRKPDQVVDLRKEIAALRVQLMEKMEERITLLEEALAKLKEDVRLILDQLSNQAKVTAGLQNIVEKGQVLNETVDAITMLNSELRSLRDGLHETLELVSGEREALIREAQRYKSEKEGLSRLREEVVRWRTELEQKERQINEAQETLKDLMRKKESLEEEVRVLTERYLTAFEDAQKKLEQFGKEMDKMFKLREIRMERMIRREKELEDRLAMLESSKAEVEKLLEDARRLKEEVAKLEAYRDSLSQEVHALEKRRAELNELMTEIRRAFLTS
jgi:chromosome segregation ATPase